MDVTPLAPKGSLVLSGYGGGGFKINNEFTPGSIQLSAAEAKPWQPAQPAEITAASLTLDLQETDLFIIGTGRNMALLPQELREFFKAKKIALEVMDTGAACRTYNVLMSEGRRVAAALIAV